MAKGGLARQRWEAQKQRNQIIAQLNQLRGAGFSTDQIRAAGNNAYRTLTQGSVAPQNVTVRDGDTIETIANAQGATPTDLLAANPDLRAPQTGMVLNVPRPQSTIPGPGWQGSPFATERQPVNINTDPEGWRLENRPGGLPSNAALGGTTNNPNGYNPYAGMNPQTSMIGRGRGTGTSFGTPTINDMPYSPFAVDARTTPVNPITNTYNVAERGANVTLAPTAASYQTVRPIQQSRVYSQESLAGLQAHRITELYNAVNAGQTPTESQLNYLIQRGLITKADTPVNYGGGGGYRRFGRGGGGGGRGGGGTTRVTQQGERIPAFSSGSGSFSLINWRL